MDSGNSVGRTHLLAFLCEPSHPAPHSKSHAMIAPTTHYDAVIKSHVNSIHPANRSYNKSASDSAASLHVRLNSPSRIHQRPFSRLIYNPILLRKFPMPLLHHVRTISEPLLKSSTYFADCLASREGDTFTHQPLCALIHNPYISWMVVASSEISKSPQVKSSPCQFSSSHSMLHHDRCCHQSVFAIHGLVTHPDSYAR